jgi:hypothetical protein
MGEVDLADYKQTLEEFLRQYTDYTSHLSSRGYGNAWTEELKRWLQRKTNLVVRIISELVDRDMLRYTMENRTYSFHAVLALTLMENATENEEFWDNAKPYIIAVINEGIGNIENDAIPPKEIEPVLPIKDEILKKRCLDLLQAAGNFDRVINQATQVLEARLRDSMPYDKLSEVIPEDKERVGEPLANKLLSPNKPVVVISDKPTERAAFHKIVVGIIAYFRNPSHHFLDDKTKWSLAWSVVGIIDSLLSQLENSYIADDTRDNKIQTKQK